MPTYGQGAPGTRIRLRDLSEVSLVNDPRIVGGAVGYSTRGEFNAIIDITSTADMDTILGNGYNNPRYNQALYATRAVINGGGFVEFVRVYGEDIIDDDEEAGYEIGQELKTDTFVVQYDFSDGTTESFDIDHFASTRYITDGMVSLGTRQIYTIADTLTNNTNINFLLDSGESATDKIPLFAIMNSDPTSSRRAGDKVSIASIYSTDGTTVNVATSSVHGFSVGDTVVVAGTVNFNGTATVASTATTSTFTYIVGTVAVANESTGAVYINEDTVDSGVDSISVKTVSTGTASKKYEYLRVLNVGTSSFDLEGKTIDVLMPDASTVTFEFDTDGSVTNGNAASTINTVTFTNGDVDITNDAITILSASNYFTVGDVIRFVLEGTYLPTGAPITVDALTTDYVVSDISGNAISLNDVNGDPIIFTDAGSGTNRLVNLTGTLRNLKAAMVTAGIDGNNPVRGIFNGTTGIDTSTNEITVDDAGLFNVGDEVMFTNAFNERGTIGLPSAIELVTLTNVYYDTVASLNLETNKVIFTNLDLTGSTTSETVNSYLQTISAVSGSTITVSDASKFQVSDQLLYTEVAALTGLVDGTNYLVSARDTVTNILTLTDMDGSALTITGSTFTSTMTNVTANEAANFRITNLTETKGESLWVNEGNGAKQLDYMGVFNLNVPVATQADSSFFDLTSVNYPTPSRFTSLYVVNSPDGIKDVESTDSGIVLDTTIGRVFMNLGIATEEYIDTDFDGVKDRIYKLTATGEQVAKIYLYVDYFFNGETFAFSGTIIPFVVGETNYYIGNSASRIENGWKFVINENVALEAATSDPDFNFSQSVKTTDGVELIESDFSQVAFNADDPAVLNDVIWEYNPNNNNSATTLSNAWQLFLNKDASGADMLIAAGTTISNLFIRGLEEISFVVMDSMLNICEKRKDMFCLFDGVDESNIDVALDKMSGAGNQGDIARWGGIWDGRSIFNDTAYTKLSVEAVKSIEVAAVIALNRAANAWWIPPAGYQTGLIPGSLAARQKYIRTYNYADDPNSDIARLYDANVNPTRVNDQGQVLYGQKTMLKRLTALSRMNVIMLIAGIHKRFSIYLDNKVFQLNTAALRANIQSELQAQIDGIISAIPAGLVAGRVICDSTNNSQQIIDTNQLIVDVVLQPTRAAEFITLRTTVQRTGEELNITDTTIIGG